MFRKIHWRPTLTAAVIGAVLFCIPVFIYIKLADYTYSWLLYIGSFLFCVVRWVHTLTESRQRGENESAVAMVFLSHIATLAGIVFSCLFCFLLLVFLVPGYLEPGMADKILSNEPASMIIDKTRGLSFEVFFAATIINFSVGSFTAIILAFYSKRDQTRDSREPTPLHQKGIH